MFYLVILPRLTGIFNSLAGVSTGNGTSTSNFTSESITASRANNIGAFAGGAVAGVAVLVATLYVIRRYVCHTQVKPAISSAHITRFVPNCMPSVRAQNTVHISLGTSLMNSGQMLLTRPSLSLQLCVKEVFALPSHLVNNSSPFMH